MRILRGVAGALLWIVAAVCGLVAVVLCISIMLLPVGLPVLGGSRRVIGMAVALVLPSEVVNQVEQTRKRLGGEMDDARSQIKTSKPGKAAGKALPKVLKRIKK